MFDRDSLKGIIPPIATPLTPDGEVDVTAMKRKRGVREDRGRHGATGKQQPVRGPARRLPFVDQVASGHVERRRKQ
jgi:hypothetical protein